MSTIVLQRPATCRECGSALPIGAQVRYYGFNGIYGIDCHNTPPKKEKALANSNWQTIYNEAHKAGLAVMTATTPTPMIVQEHEHILDDKSPVIKAYKVLGGVCGFAWIVIRPGTCSFARWLTKKGLAKKAYEGGVSVWVAQGGQSMELKQAYANAFAATLRAHKINAYPMSRVD